MERIVLPNGYYVYDEYIPHDFNIINEKVIDYTYKKIMKETPHYFPKKQTEY